jgi:hypothetical protein
VRVAIKYCGSCNPETDVSWIGSAIQSKLEAKQLKVLPVDSAELDAVIVICGCPRACIDRLDMHNGASAFVIVAGKKVDFVPVVESHIPTRVVQVLEELRNLDTGNLQEAMSLESVGEKVE